MLGVLPEDCLGEFPMCLCLEQEEAACQHSCRVRAYCGSYIVATCIISDSGSIEFHH